MKFFNKHFILKLLVVIIISLFTLVLAYSLGVFLDVTPHVALTYMTSGIIVSWVTSTLYDRFTNRKDSYSYEQADKYAATIKYIKEELVRNQDSYEKDNKE